MSFISDLFKGLGNNRFDLARVSAGWALFIFSGAFLADSIVRWLHGQYIADYTAIGLGFASVMAGAGGLIFAKDTARTNAVSQVTKDANPAPPPTVVKGDLNAENIEHVQMKDEK